MTSKLYVSKIADGGEIELTAFVPQKGSPFFDHNTSLVELGHRFANGEASQGTFKLQDPSGEFPAADGSFNLAAHKLVTWTEDASGSELWLSRGRVSSFEVGRGKFTLDNVIEVDATVDDCNVDLGFLAFTEPWVRPQEAGWDRVAALHSYILNGASSTAPTFRGSTDVYFADSHLAPNTARVTMPAKTYPVGTQPGEVVIECADVEGKVWGVVIHHLAGSHLCLRYHAENNHAIHPSPIKISDNLADWDPEDLSTPVFEPHWEMGKASLWDSQELITGLVSTWGPEQTPIFVENSGSVDDYEYWIDSFSDSESTTQEQAEFVANAMLDYRAASNITHRVSIIMLPEQLGLVTVGQSLDIKAAAAMAGHFLDEYQTRRVAELTFEPRTDGRYWAHMHLDRVVRRRPARRGTGSTGPQPPPPTPAVECGTPTVVATFGECWDETGNTIEQSAVPVGANQSILLLIGIQNGMNTPEWYPQGGVPFEVPELFTQVGAETWSDGAQQRHIAAWQINDPTPGAAGLVRFTGTNQGRARVLVVHVLSRNALVRDVAIAHANTTDPAVTVDSASGDLVLDLAQWVNPSDAGADTLPGAGQTDLFVDWFDRVGGLDDNGAAAGIKAAGASSTAFSRTYPNTRRWGHLAVSMSGAGGDDCDEPAPVDEEGSLGEANGHYANADHTHAHDFQDDSGSHHHAVSITLTDAASDFTATEVEGALAELQADAEGHLADAADAHDASAVSFSPTGTISATDVQAAIAEVASEAAVTTLNALTDVTITSPAHLHGFVYDDVSAQWVNSAGVWRPLMDGAGAVITDGATGEAVMAFS